MKCDLMPPSGRLLYTSLGDEIGELATAFNAMLAELAAARERKG